MDVKLYNLVAGILLTLLVVPVFYTFFDDAQLVAGRAIRHALGAAPPGGRADTGSALPEPR